jgi:hypothetical protein
MTEEHSEEEAGGRIEEVGQLRGRGVPFGEIARRFNRDERQIRGEWQSWLGRRKTERAADGLQLEETLGQYDEVLRAAWRDHELLEAGTTGLDAQTARARSESLRVALGAIDRRASLLGLSRRAQGAGRTSSSPSRDGHQGNGGSTLYNIKDLDALRREIEGRKSEDIEGYRMLIEEAKELGVPLPEPVPLSPEEEEDEAWLAAREAEQEQGD